MSTQPRRLKVVLEELDNGVMVGVSATGCDPQMSVIQAQIVDLLEPQVADRVEAATQHWAQHPKNPAYERPPEPKKPAASPSRTSTSTRRREPEATQQQLM